jgi:hypothetical protein
LALASAASLAQVPQYGPNVTLEQAKKAIAADQDGVVAKAGAEALK